ncbi:hypothetical protein BpHYR1_038330 [Brachionus plicatilis]|uniref:Uncharacterized protein n=1 Tax=Brachionus plicatilis TaxID=10195 RepID=A0A3M7SGM9_BRAPC|nr:hypothetical protein BpHYR1_038330 [Brachionus plicatilis]
MKKFYNFYSKTYNIINPEEGLSVKTRRFLQKLSLFFYFFQLHFTILHFLPFLIFVFKCIIAINLKKLQLDFLVNNVKFFELWQKILRLRQNSHFCIIISFIYLVLDLDLVSHKVIKKPYCFDPKPSSPKRNLRDSRAFT